MASMEEVGLLSLVNLFVLSGLAVGKYSPLETNADSRQTVGSFRLLDDCLNLN